MCDEGCQCVFEHHQNGEKKGLEKFGWEGREFEIVLKNAKLVEISFLFLCVFLHWLSLEFWSKKLRECVSRV